MNVANALTKLVAVEALPATGIPFEDLVKLNQMIDGAMDQTHLRALAARAVFDAWRLGREHGLREAARIAKGDV